jgi:hypothetical protein
MTTPTLDELMAAATAAIEAQKTPEERAFWEGHNAGKRRAGTDENPYVNDQTLFDPEQLASAWFKGRKGALDAIYAKRPRQRAWNRA